jgi:arylsulfatase
MENANHKVRREILPVPDITPTGLTTYDAKDADTKFPPIHQLRPPAGAPNVLVILIDDAGFGASSAFGGPCQTPTLLNLSCGVCSVPPSSNTGIVHTSATSTSTLNALAC